MHPIRKQKLIVVSSILVAVAILASLILFALSQNINLFYTPTQIKAGEAPQNKSFRAGGMVVEKSLVRGEDLFVSFAVTDFKEQVTIRFKGILPDLFREGQGIVVDGKMASDGSHIIASEVLAKHDENYMPPQVEDMLKNNVETSKEISKSLK